MDLINRYLQAIRFWMPFSRNRDDILRELGDELQSQLDEKRDTLGRELADSDIAEVIRRFGRPFAVAGRFLPQETLIGSALFPLYAQVLRLMLWLIALGWLVSTCALLASSSHPFSAAFNNLFKYLAALIYMFGLVTLTFAALERRSGMQDWTRDWDPRQLPAVRDPWLIPRSHSIPELVFNTVFLAVWLVPALLEPVLAGLAHTGWTTGQVIKDFHEACFWAVALTAAINIVLAAVAIADPVWTRARLLARAAGYTLFCVAALQFFWPTLAHLDELSRQVFSGVDSGRAGMTQFTDLMFVLGILLGTVITLGRVSVDLWRATRASPAPRSVGVADVAH